MSTVTIAHLSCRKGVRPSHSATVSKQCKVR